MSTDLQPKKRRSDEGGRMCEPMMLTPTDRGLALIDTIALQSVFERRYPLGLLSTEGIQALLEPLNRI